MDIEQSTTFMVVDKLCIENLRYRAKKAKEDNKETFMYRGVEILVKYAEYLADFGEAELRKKLSPKDKRKIE
jgi:hypothetical protein